MKHTILFLAANPSRTDRLALDQEASAIQVELERSRWRDCFEFVTRWAAEPLDVIRELRRLRPTVVHFSGHGGPDATGRHGLVGRRDVFGADDAAACPGLYFHGPDGSPRRVSAGALRDAFGAAGSSVKLAVLSACYSEAAAQALLGHVDCVVGMSGAIHDDAARSFAIGFYGGLGECESIEAAYRGGCAAIGLDGFFDYDRPQLKAHRAIDPGAVILAELAPAVSTPVPEDWTVAPGRFATDPPRHVSSGRDATGNARVNGREKLGEAQGRATRYRAPLAASARGSMAEMPSGTRRHGIVPSTDALGATAGMPDAPVQLLRRTLDRHLGDDALDVARRLVERLAVANGVADPDLFDVTRFAVEYQLLVAEALTPTLLLDFAYGRHEDSLKLKEFLRLLRDAVTVNKLGEVVVKVEPHCFFSRTLERQEDWKIYFETVRELSENDPAPGRTLCRIRTNGCIAPQFLVTGLLSRFEDNWRPIITEYEHQVEGDQSPFVSFQASQWNTWLLWGPSIPICQCDEWAGIRAFQYGYGDENNSIPIIGTANNVPTSLEEVSAAYNPKDPSVGAVLRRVTGRLRWSPWLFRRSTGESTPEQRGRMSGDLTPSGFSTSPAARAQRALYEKDRQGNEHEALLLEIDEIKECRPAEQSYFSAYLWLMFLVGRHPVAPGQAPRRLADTYPALAARAVDRRGRRLWRELLPIYVHANIADPKALGTQRRTLANNAVNLLRDLWTDRSRQFPGIDDTELCFCLVGGSDYSGCGQQIRTPSSDPLLQHLRVRLANESDRRFAASILLPPDDESCTTRPRELAAFYSTCHLPDLIADYYSYVEELKGD